MTVIRRPWFLFLIFTILLPLAGVAEAPHELLWHADRDFRILILADPQDTEQPQQAMLNLLNASLDRADPDLVVFLGDMIHGPAVHGEENVRKAIEAIVRPVADRGIPFALVFGNHDHECGMENEQLLSIFRSYPGCLAIDGEDLPGCGNYYLLIDNPVQPESPLVLWFLDSGDHAEPGRGTYGYVHEEQNNWMLAAYRSLLDRYPNPVSFAFQHIPVPQVYSMLQEVSFGTKDAVTCLGPFFGKWYVPGPMIRDGTLGEGPCSSEYDSGEFDTWKKMNLKAAFFGHDHLNDYVGTWEGIDLIATSGLGFYMYGRGDEHGSRLITFRASNPAAYTTSMLYYRDLVSEPLPNPFVSSWGVMFQNYALYALAGIALLILVIILSVRAIKKGKDKKSNGRKEQKASAV